MNRETELGGAARGFPPTRHSLIARVASADAGERTRAYDALVSAYWKPTYKHVRLKWRKSVEDAKDLTQGFFAAAIEKEFFAGFDPARARFRTYLRTCVDGFAMNSDKAARRQKRGGERPPLSLDFAAAEGELARAQVESPLADTDLDRVFDDEWVKGLFTAAVTDLERDCAARGRTVHFALFQRCDLEPPGGERPSYDALAREFGCKVTDVTNWLALARREFRRCVLDRLRAITGSDEEYRDEARALLGLDVA